MQSLDIFLLIKRMILENACTVIRFNLDFNDGDWIPHPDKNVDLSILPIDQKIKQFDYSLFQLIMKSCRQLINGRL